MSARTRTPGPAITAAWTRSAGPAGKGRGRSRGSTSPTGAFSARCTRWPWRPERIGDTVEHERCAQFLRDSSETAYADFDQTISGSTAEAGDTPEEVR